MRMFNGSLLCAVAGFVLATTGISGVVNATVIADYQDEFQVTGGPAAGWSYLWNPSAALGDADNYVSLVNDNGRYETVANTDYPDAAPGSSLAVGSGPADSLMFPANPSLPPLPSTYVRPGQGAAQASDSIERAAVVGYTFSAADIAAGGTLAQITDYYFAVSATSADPMTARVYHRAAGATTDTLILDFVFPAGFTFYTALDPDPIPLATVGPGDTIYFALGSFLGDAGDEMRLDFTLSLVPEPSSAMLVAFGVGGLALRRRRRR